MDDPSVEPRVLADDPLVTDLPVDGECNEGDGENAEELVDRELDEAVVPRGARLRERFESVPR